MIDSRTDQILRLLDTRFDNLPEQSRRTNTTAGFVHKAPSRSSCPDCLANDRTMYGCETCHGRGFIEEMRDRDPYAVDKVQPYGLDGSERERIRAIESAISVAGRELQRFPGFRPASSADEIEDANQHPYAWETARRKMYAEFDYAALDRALEQLHNFYPDRSPRSPFGLLFLSLRLPDPLRAPGGEPVTKIGVGRVAKKAGADVMAERDEEIRRAVLDERIATEDVARTWGITARQVNRIIARSEAA